MDGLAVHIDVGNWRGDKLRSDSAAVRSGNVGGRTCSDARQDCFGA